jgi:trehalose/maltose hydrolase-like predicted phosphorylase
MGGTWMSVVLGFGGMRIREDMLSFNPSLPKKWRSLSFFIYYRGRKLKVSISEKKVNVNLIEGEPLAVEINGNKVECIPEK